MSRFWSSLSTNLASLPANLRNGLRPGTGAEDQTLNSRMRRNLVFHLHPVRVTPRALKPATTLGLGVITLTLFAILSFTGILLMIYYVPTTQKALSSTQDIEYAVTFGSFVRALHRYSAHAMVLTAFLHLLRICFTGAYFKRELNWGIGLGLFLVTLGLAFTGYLLPWDQLSFWAVNVSANLLDHAPWIGEVLRLLLLGGKEVGQAALIRFYTLHVALLPGAMLGLVVLHLWRIRKDDGLAREPGGKEDPASMPAWPHLLLREAILVMAVVTLLCIVSALFSAPLGGAPDIHNPSNPEKTPWYFLWLQEMVSYSALVGGFLVPGILIIGLGLLPFFEREPEGVGQWFGRPRTRAVFAAAFLIALIAFVSFQWIYQLPGVELWCSSYPPWINDLANPATGLLLLALAGFVVAGTWFGSTRAAFLASGAVLVVAIVGFTLVAWCRGPGWIFYWPWEEWPLVY